LSPTTNTPSTGPDRVAVVVTNDNSIWGSLMFLSRTAWARLPVRRRDWLSFLLFTVLFVSTARAQQRSDSTEMPMARSMTMRGPLGISTDRMGSGTTWVPDAVTLPSRQTMMGPWSIMLHGFAFFQYDKQSGPRGASQFGSL